MTILRSNGIFSSAALSINCTGNAIFSNAVSILARDTYANSPTTITVAGGSTLLYSNLNRGYTTLALTSSNTDIKPVYFAKFDVSIPGDLEIITDASRPVVSRIEISGRLTFTTASTYLNFRLGTGFNEVASGYISRRTTDAGDIANTSGFILNDTGSLNEVINFYAEFNRVTNGNTNLVSVFYDAVITPETTRPALCSGYLSNSSFNDFSSIRLISDGVASGTISILCK